MSEKLKQHLPLIIILVIAVFVRFYGLTTTPPSLNWDEVSHGYNAYSILHSGRDEWGVKIPIIFRAYGDYKLPVYIYTTAISIALLGLTTLAIRLPSAIAGVLLVFYTYRLAKLLFNKDIAILASFLVAVEPWSLFLSRIALEANLSQALIVAGAYYLLTGIKEYKKLILGIFLLGLSVWTYNSARVFVPLLILAFLLIYLKEISRLTMTNIRATTGVFLLCALFFGTMLIQLSGGTGQARYKNVSIINEGSVAVIEQKRNNTSLPAVVSKFVYNRPVYFATNFGNNYLSHFSPRFLFFEGGSDYQFNIPNTGLLYIVNIVPFYAGLIALIKRAKADRHSLLLLSWIVLSPIPASITRESPHTLRDIVALPTPMILSSLGVFWILSLFAKFKKYQIHTAAIYVFVVAFLAGSYLADYFNQYRVNYSWSWQYGYKQVVELIEQDYNNYDKIIFTKKYGEPHEFLLFYGAQNNDTWYSAPENYFNNPNLIRFNQSDWWWVDSFDKFYFVNDWEIPHEFGKPFVMESGGTVSCDTSNSKCLLVTSPGNAPEKWTKIETIYFLNGDSAFEIYEI